MAGKLFDWLMIKQKSHAQQQQCASTAVPASDLSHLSLRTHPCRCSCKLSLTLWWMLGKQRMLQAITCPIGCKGHCIYLVGDAEVLLHVMLQQKTPAAGNSKRALTLKQRMHA